jgi:hypothetical protein
LWLGAERYIEVRYEDLVQRPREELEHLCAFLGEDFHPDLLKHTRLARQVVQPEGPVNVTRDIFTSSVQRWKGEMVPFDRKIADLVAGPALSSDALRTGLYAMGVLKIRRGLGPGRP